MAVDLAVAVASVVGADLRTAALSIRFADREFDGAATGQIAAKAMSGLSFVATVGLTFVVIGVVAVLGQTGQSCAGKVDFIRNLDGR